MLLRRVEELENMVPILKTVNCTIHFPRKEKLHELGLLYDQYDVYMLCEALDVSRGTLFFTVTEGPNIPLIGLDNYFVSNP